MKKMFLPAALLLCMFFSCKEKQTGGSVTTGPANPSSEIKLPLELWYNYKKAEIGNYENMVTVMKWNKFLGEKKVDSACALLADSVTIYLADGTMSNTVRDSVKAQIGAFINSMKTITIKYMYALPLNAVFENKTEEWVESVTDEEYFFKDGKHQHSYFSEDYRMENGKIRLVYQYERKILPPPPAKK